MPNLEIQFCKDCTLTESLANCVCYGCGKYFCLNHFTKHRKHLSKDFHVILDSRDRLELDIHRREINWNSGEILRLFDQIQQWKNDTIQSVIRTAEETMDAVKKKILQKNDLTPSKEKLQQINIQLKNQQKSQVFFERDIKRWSDELQNIRNGLDRLPVKTKPLIKLEINSIQWSNFLRVIHLDKPQPTSVPFAVVDRHTDGSVNIFSLFSTFIFFLCV